MGSKRILIMGLPGSGKSTLACKITTDLFFKANCVWLNADAIREKYNDWDFSYIGRIRQSHRMLDEANKNVDCIVIADFVAALPEQRAIYNADFTIWVDTIKAGRFDDTNKAFVPPDKYDIKVTEQDSAKWSLIIIARLNHERYI